MLCLDRHYFRAVCTNTQDIMLIRTGADDLVTSASLPAISEDVEEEDGGK